MKRLLSIAVLAAAVVGAGLPVVLTTSTARADEVAATALPAGKEVIERFIQATGGREAYAKFTSRTTKGTLDIPAQGMKASLTIFQLAPDKGLVESEIPALGVMKQGSDGETAWSIDPMQGARILSGGERDTLIRQFRFDGDSDWEKYYKSAETIGVEDVDGKPAYKVKLTPVGEGLADSVGYYDKESGLVVRMDTVMQSPMGELAVVSKISNYKDFGGIKIPTTTVQEVAGMTMSMTVESVDHDTTLDEAKFALPADIEKLKAQQAPAAKPGE